jgi:uncharacterized RDD family membrane protein YckC
METITAIVGLVTAIIGLIQVWISYKKDEQPIQGAHSSQLKKHSPQSQLRSHSRDTLETYRTLEYANLGQRLVAFFLDCLVCYAIIFIPLLPYDSAPNAVEMLYLATAIIPITYHVILETFLGATFGKSITGIAITDLQGYKITFGTSVSRFILKALSILFFGLGIVVSGILILRSSKKQSLHDSWTDSVVVKRRSLGG